ncbi:MAG: protein kinase [Myxococcota bacterium]
MAENAEPNESQLGDASSSRLSPSIDPFASEASGEPSEVSAPSAPTGRGGTVILDDVVEPQSRTSLRPGTPIGENGRYLIESELGAGGMGRVFKALDTKFTPPRPVAIKMQRSSVTLHEEAKHFRQRFETESSLPAQLGHPNIITIFDRGVYDADTDFFVMEFIENSRSLQDEVRAAHQADTFIELDRIQAWFEQAGRALKKLHAREGAWHRDIKLANFVVFSSEGDEFLKLIDFGVAHKPDAELTQTGALLGTSNYISPEFFARSKTGLPLELDHRSDLYSLGITLYRCLTLVHPYPSIRCLQTALHAHQSPDELPLLPSVHRPDLPQGWDTLTMGLLERDREKRYQCAADFLTDLRRVNELPAYAGNGARTPNDLIATDEPSRSITQLPREPTPKPLPSDPLGDVSLSVQPSYAASRVAAPPPPADAPSNGAPPPVDGAMPSALHSAVQLAPPSDELSQVGNSDYVAVLRQMHGETDDSKTRARRRIVYTAGAALVAFVVIAFAAHLLTNFQLPSSNDLVQQPLGPQSDSESQRKALASKENDEPAIFSRRPTPASEPAVAAPEGTPAPNAPQTEAELKAALAAKYAEKPSAAPAARRRSKARRAPAGPAEPENEWERYYGKAVTNTGIFTFKASSDGDTTAAKGDVSGLRLAATLMDNVASNPGQAPVIAKITKKTKLGGVVIPAGSEIHGHTRGATNTRVLVDFSFIRLSSGKVVHLKALARGRDGRLGVPGKKLVDARTGGSVAVSGAGSALGAAASGIANSLGTEVGSSAVSGAGNTARQNAERFDHSERVVIAKRGTPLVVYVKELVEKKR